MRQAPLISVQTLQELLERPEHDVVVLDCRYELADTGAGYESYQAAHIPGARYVHLSRDLSGEATGKNGRHPLPPADELIECVQGLGINRESLVVTYDQGPGMFAARCWWMLRCLGHPQVRVLDGGLAAWKNAGYATHSLAAEQPAAPIPAGNFQPAEPCYASVTREDVLKNLDEQTYLVVDARSKERYLGGGDALDTKSGHIPHAKCRFFRNNLTDDGLFKPAEALRAEFIELLAGRDPKTIIHQCGSGVSACHNLLAMEVAGLSGSRLYPGSWSEWTAYEDAPVAQGEE